MTAETVVMLIKLKNAQHLSRNLKFTKTKLFCKIMYVKKSEKMHNAEIQRVHSMMQDGENFLIVSVAVDKSDWYETAIINHKAVPMKPDTRAQCNTIHYKLAKGLGLKMKPSNIH